MDKSTEKRIQKLLDTSGLLPKKESTKQNFNSYDFSGETILITGAAGSIGSGLVQHLIHSKFKTLVLVDNAETPLYYLKNSSALKKSKSIKFVLSDICDRTSMQWLFEDHRPTLVFHGAAYKHVSLMEQNPYEAVKVNIWATKNLAKLAIKHGVNKFIFISTDKAVNPTGIMGMTKNIAESFLHSLGSSQKTTFVTARFGNIFGSNGSVAPLFLKQLERGEHLTVTDSNVSRLFIDKHKACDLILKTSKLESSENIKVSFDMGKPIKITDLAEMLIETYNTVYQCNVAPTIEITGLANGEKMDEEIISENETLSPSATHGIFYVKNKKDNTENIIDISSLENIIPSMSYEKIKALLKPLCSS